MQKAILVSLMIALAVVAVMPFVMADTLNISSERVEVNGLEVDGDIAGEAGEVVPVDIYFTADEDASDVEISAWMQGHRSDGTEVDFRDLLNGSRYHARLSLRLPTNVDPEEDLTLYVRIETDAGNWEDAYTIKMQREPHRAELLFVEVDRKVQAGSNVPVDVVVKNLGRQELEDLVVSVNIPELEVSKRAYFGDLTPLDDWEGDDDAEDAAERRIYIRIPVNTRAGVYELEVEVYNSDVRDIVTRELVVMGAEQSSSVFVPVTSKEIGTGETKTYELVLVNSGTNVGVYEMIPETAEGVIVSVTEPIVTIPAGSSKVVEVNVKAGSREGTYSFAVNINSEGQLVERVTLNANVTREALGTNLTILTVVLAIIFVVLLIVLIVLLTRKPKAEELEESYY